MKEPVPYRYYLRDRNATKKTQIEGALYIYVNVIGELNTVNPLYLASIIFSVFMP